MVGRDYTTKCVQVEWGRGVSSSREKGSGAGDIIRHAKTL
jgi:hypothetical protein